MKFKSAAKIDLLFKNVKKDELSALYEILLKVDKDNLSIEARNLLPEILKYTGSALNKFSAQNR